MTQFPTRVRVKFVRDAAFSNFTIVAGVVERTTNLELVPYNTFSPGGASWHDIGNTGTAATTPLGWLTWENTYQRYKVLAVKVELFLAPLSGDYGLPAILTATPWPSDGLQPAFPGVMSDPRTKQAPVDYAANGQTELNQPSIMYYLRPRDLWFNNVDWSKMESVTTAQPTRFMKLRVSLVRTKGDTTSNISYILRARVTMYTELFDRVTQLDRNMAVPVELLPALSLMDTPGVVDLNVDRKIQV